MKKTRMFTELFLGVIFVVLVVKVAAQFSTPSHKKNSHKIGNTITKSELPMKSEKIDSSPIKQNLTVSVGNLNSNLSTEELINDASRLTSELSNEEERKYDELHANEPPSYLNPMLESMAYAQEHDDIGTLDQSSIDESISENESIYLNESSEPFTQDPNEFQDSNQNTII